MGRITTAGTVTSYGPATQSPLEDITTGPDGALWFTGTGIVGRITTAGVITDFADSRFENVGGIVAGPGGAMWLDGDDGSGHGWVGEIATGVT
ncbi:MAG TPA: hypothetical protein VG435_00770 [Acidimicrobiales bacterium]|nr:hypothetical protein [Acidimicrobiales bacterium]